MTGMDRTTGKPMSGIDHIAQSIRDILTTPVGSRICRRAYGSDLHRLIDAPMNAKTRALMCAATAAAIARWEPRVRLTRVNLSNPTSDGALKIEIEAKRIDLPVGAASSSALTLQIPL